MINRLQLLRNVGQFESAQGPANIQLSRYVVVYAENGRGKTTLSAILRSLATGDPVHILERRRLSTQHPPHVILECSGGPPPAMFQDGRWNRTLPNLTVFDDTFVDENVFSGLSVGPEHRQHLHKLVLGAQGVRLNQQLEDAVTQVEADNAEIRNRAEQIPAVLRMGMPLEEFCALPQVPRIEDEIAATERTIAAARAQQPIRETPVFGQLLLPPPIDPRAVAELPARTLQTLDTDAAAQVEAHLFRLGPGSESWVAQGVRYVMEKAEAPGSCPFCTQGLDGIGILDSYRAYFSQEYARLKQEVNGSIAFLGQTHGENAQVTFERSLRIAVELRQFWSRFVAIPEIQLDSAAIVAAWQAARDTVVKALSAKSAAPLEKMELSEDALTAISQFEANCRTVAKLDFQLRKANAAIEDVKRQSGTANLGDLQGALSRLQAARERHLPETNNLCRAYLAAKEVKTAIEATRDQLKANLEDYRKTSFPRYQEGINKYLERFNAGFRIDGVTAADTRGGPTCNYEILINNTVVPVSRGADQKGEPSFCSTLSAGDRNTLALAFFFASLDEAPNLAETIVVIDDPISSLDDHRSLTTVQELRRVGDRVSQLIILSHNKPFLCRIYERIDPMLGTPIKLERIANGSTLTQWDVNQDSITEHDRRHQLLKRFQANGAENNSREVARSIRPHLEAFLRVACPDTFPPGTLLGPFLNLCRERYGLVGEVLNHQLMSDLGDLVEYSNRYHHDTNPAWQTEAINDGELTGYVGRALTFARR
jgi:wobble nucleotide-excising tRNase